MTKLADRLEVYAQPMFNNSKRQVMLQAAALLREAEQALAVFAAEAAKIPDEYLSHWEFSRSTAGDLRTAARVHAKLKGD